MKMILRIWGVLSLFCGALNLILALYAGLSPNTVFNPGSTGLGEWIGMGVLSLGLAAVLDRLDEHDSNNDRKD